MGGSLGGQPTEDGDRINHLARIAADPSASLEDRNVALTELRPSILRWARQVAGRFREPVRSELLDEAFSHVWEAIPQFTPGQAKLRGWCRTVLFNLGVDLWRRHKRRTAMQLDGCRWEPEAAGPRPEAACTAMDECHKIRRQRREVLDELSRVWCPTGEVNYPAAFLLRCRLAISASVARALPDDWYVPPMERRSHLIDSYFPWRDQECGWAFRAGWPSLGAIWRQVSGLIDAPPYFLDDMGFCELMSEMLGQSVSTDLWQQWGRRAKEQARPFVGEKRWSELFADLLPDRCR